MVLAGVVENRVAIQVSLVAFAVTAAVIDWPTTTFVVAPPLTVAAVIVMPAASVNVACAVRPEACPVAVSVNLTPTSVSSTPYWWLKIRPLASATVVRVLSGWMGGSTCSWNRRLTVSPGAQPAPVTVIVSPGW